MISNLGPYAFIAFLPVIFYLILTGIGIYFIIKVVKFLNAKTRLEQERNAKIDELIDAVKQSKTV